MYDFYNEDTYDMNEAVTYIARRSDIPEDVIVKVLELELEYMEDIGLAEEY